jgi:predicted NACHT family NTPase
MLSLLCILYRGQGSLPRHRSEVYEQCAMLMFRRWDARRRIYQDLRAGGQLEPTLRHLAWWLFTREDPQSAVTERELVDATAEFLQSRAKARPVASHCSVPGPSAGFWPPL